MAASSSKEFTVVRQLSADTFMVRRKSDGEPLLGRTFDVAKWPDAAPLHSLMTRGAGEAAFNVMNHENLVSVAAVLMRFPFDGSGVEASDLLLVDYCDAGTLMTLLDRPPVQHTATGFLPESLCWHVARSLLRALAFLHDGYRCDSYTAPRSGARRFHEWVADRDWMPILHRNIRPENIFFQQPRGRETYGLCKLGNFSECFVSGHVNWMSGGAVVSAPDKDCGLETMRARMAVENVYELPKVWTSRFSRSEVLYSELLMKWGRTQYDRPYTRGSELFALGALLYRMMTSRICPHPEECNLLPCQCRHMDPSAEPCPHACHPPINLENPLPQCTDYTDGLHDLIKELLVLNRSDAVSAVELLASAEEAFQTWRETTLDGGLYVDLEDDLKKREANLRKKMDAEACGQGQLIPVGVL